MGASHYNDYLIMQLRLSNGSHSPFHGPFPQTLRRPKQQAIFTYNNRELSPRNVYYDNNPYFLHTSPSDPHMKTPISTSRNSSRGRELTDSNRQRSCKVIRANGLRLIEKPILARPQDQSPMTSSRYDERTRRMLQRELELQAENRVLKGENQYLKQKIRQVEESKQSQVKHLQERIEHLLQLTHNLQRKMEHSQTEWKEEIRKLNQSQMSDM